MSYTDGKYGIVIFTQTDENLPGKVIITVGTTQNILCAKAGDPYTKPCGRVLRGFHFFFNGTDGTLWTAKKVVDEKDAQAVFDELVEARRFGTLAVDVDC